MSDKEKELDKRIEEVKQQKEELLLEEGKAYRCTKCGKITMKRDGLLFSRGHGVVGVVR